MLDLRTLRDEEVIALVGEAKGWEREMLLDVLGFSQGEAGVAFLRSQLDQRRGGSSHLRAAVLRTLAQRVGAAAVPDLTAALSGGTLESQLAALWALERVDEDGAAADAVIGWLAHRLRAPRRAGSWGYDEVSGVLRYAARVHALPRLLDVVERNFDRLQLEERELLDQAWPPAKRCRFRRTEDDVDGPDAAAMEAWYQLSATDLDDAQALSSLIEGVAPVIERLRKRRQRTNR